MVKKPAPRRHPYRDHVEKPPLVEAPTTTLLNLIGSEIHAGGTATLATDSLHTGFGDAWADIIGRSSLLVLYTK
ncbi:hypothetical protein MRX96_044001 [Rhipicephalus microplus]